MTPAVVERTDCGNCGHPLDGAYCAACGQKATAPNPSLRDVVHELREELLAVDGRIFRSVGLLLARPGFLTREHFAGRRARYLSPLRLYLVFSVVFFAVAVVAPKRPGEGIQATVTYDDAEARQRGFASARELEQAFQSTVTTAVDSWAPRAMFVLMPLFAVFAKWTTRGSGSNYPQHLYFALHLHAAAFAFLAAAMLARFAPPHVSSSVALVINASFAAYSCSRSTTCMEAHGAGARPHRCGLYSSAVDGGRHRTRDGVLYRSANGLLSGGDGSAISAPPS